VKQLVYKICAADDWREAVARGSYNGSADDLRDGFIHLSARRQVLGTLEKHFKDKRDLVLVAFETEALGSALKWEPSRGGELFPHLYVSLRVEDARWVRPIGHDTSGKLAVDEALLAC